MVLSIERSLSAAIKARKRVYLLAKQINANVNKALICGADKDPMEVEFHSVCGPRYHVVGPQSPLYDTAYRIVDHYPLIHKVFMEKLEQTGSFGWIERIHMETEHVHWVQNEEVDDLCNSNSDDGTTAMEECFGTDVTVNQAEEMDDVNGSPIDKPVPTQLPNTTRLTDEERRKLREALQLEYGVKEIEDAEKDDIAFQHVACRTKTLPCCSSCPQTPAYLGSIIKKGLDNFTKNILSEKHDFQTICRAFE
ncbi:hypothetical protein M3Y95_00898000 [Aphelenchoides besseyi]|nr:hypothetical protein M3Y95_00898000 [Aphelenchoides besseyi]